ncbi:deazapurine DNA modification protein DpdA family protein [Actinokineospora sp. NPDC004072]
MFYVGAHHPHWLWQRGLFPLFVSHRRLAARSPKGLRPAVNRYAVDSGGFTELSMHGGWKTSPEEYVQALYRYRDRLGMPDFIAPQDWMCEPFMLARTGLTIAEHHARTVGNFLRLRELAPDLPIIPVVQGWALGDYLRCVDLYQAAGVDLRSFPTVGLGSVCRRQSTEEITEIVTTLAGMGLRLHGFGVKTGGLARYGQHLASADSMAWSFRARRAPALPGCTNHRNCANCPRYARQWRSTVLERLTRGCARGQQLAFFPTPEGSPA